MKLKISLAASLLLAINTSLLAAPAPPPEKLVPDTAWALLTVPDYSKSSEVLGQSAGSQWWNDPAMKPFREKVVTKFKADVVTPVEREFGIKLNDFAALAQGQLTLAITPNDPAKEDSEPGFVLVVDSGTKSNLLHSTLADIKKRWVDTGKNAKTEKVRDVEFTTFIFMSDDISRTLDKAFPDPNAGFETLEDPKPKKKPTRVEWLAGQSGNLFILGNNAKDIEKVLIRQADGAVPSLSERANFASSYGSMFKDAQAYGWVNFKAIMDAIVKKASSSSGADKLLAGLGLTAVQNLSFSLKQNPEGTSGAFLISVPESGRKGLFKLLSMEAKDANPPSFVPADATKFSRWRFDISKAFSSLEAMVNELNPAYAGVMKLLLDNAGKDKDPNFDLRKNLIANLGDDIINFEKAPKKQTLQDLSSPPSLTLISSPKPEQLASAMSALTSVMPSKGAKIKEREFLGRKVYALPLPPSSNKDGTKGADRSLHYAASGSYVAMSTDVALLEEYLRGNTAKSLAETPGLADAAQKVGGMNTGLFGYENQAATTKATFEILKKESGSLANLLGNSPLAGRLGMAEDDKKFKEWFDFSLLPNWDQISKYFYYNVWGGSFNSEGVSFRFFAPTPPGLKK